MTSLPRNPATSGAALAAPRPAPPRVQPTSQPPARPVQPPVPPRGSGRRPVSAPLDPEPRAFAGVGTRLLAFTIDVAAVVIIGAVAWVATGRLGYGAIAAGEAVIGLWGWEATRGLTLGNWLLKTRTMRAEARMPIGTWRATVKYVLLGCSAAVAAVGAWLLIATAAFDPQRKRAWHDIASKSQNVRLPLAASAYAAEPRQASPADVLDRQPFAGSIQHAPRRVSLAELPTPVRPTPPAASGRSASGPAQPPAAPVRSRRAARHEAQPVGTHGAPPRAGQLSQQPAVVSATGMPPAPHPSTLVPPQTPPVPTASGSIQRIGSQRLLLSFDDGQRLQMLAPGVAVLGRRPSVRALGEQQLAIQDASGTVSKDHLEIVVEDHTIWVTDLGSTNGSSMVDDEGRSSELRPGVRTALAEGGRVEIGDRTFSVAQVRG